MDNTYNGWKNYETWNVALSIGNDEGLHALAQTCGNYAKFLEIMPFDCLKTPDGISYRDSKLDIVALNKMIREL